MTILIPLLPKGASCIISSQKGKGVKTNSRSRSTYFCGRHLWKPPWSIYQLNFYGPATSVTLVISHVINCNFVSEFHKTYSLSFQITGGSLHVSLHIYGIFLGWPDHRTETLMSVLSGRQIRDIQFQESQHPGLAQDVKHRQPYHCAIHILAGNFPTIRYSFTNSSVGPKHAVCMDLDLSLNLARRINEDTREEIPWNEGKRAWGVYDNEITAAAFGQKY